MAKTSHRRLTQALLGAFVAGALVLPAPALGQRDPAYQSARAAGQVGEKMDGYLGVVGAQPGSIQDLAADINIKRRENYAAKAQQQGVTLQEYAFTQGCILIARTTPGEKYQAPDGSWQTRGSGPAIRDSRCP